MGPGMTKIQVSLLCFTIRNTTMTKKLLFCSIKSYGQQNRFDESSASQFKANCSQPWENTELRTVMSNQFGNQNFQLKNKNKELESQFPKDFEIDPKSQNPLGFQVHGKFFYLSEKLQSCWRRSYCHSQGLPQYFCVFKITINCGMVLSSLHKTLERENRVFYFLFH